MNAKHTPGPWTAFNHSWSDTSITAPNFDHAVCLLDINHATEESQETDEAQMAANARLIAAAPDLLGALLSVLDSLGALTKRHELMNYMSEQEADAVFAAIAKATGETP